MDVRLVDAVSVAVGAVEACQRNISKCAVTRFFEAIGAQSVDGRQHAAVDIRNRGCEGDSGTGMPRHKGYHLFSRMVAGLLAILVIVCQGKIRV